MLLCIVSWSYGSRQSKSRRFGWQQHDILLVDFWNWCDCYSLILRWYIYYIVYLERLEHGGSDSKNRRPSLAADSGKEMQKRLFLLQEELKLQKVIEEGLQRELRDAKATISLLQGNLSLED